MVITRPILNYHVHDNVDFEKQLLWDETPEILFDETVDLRIDRSVKTKFVRSLMEQTNHYLH